MTTQLLPPDVPDHETGVTRLEAELEVARAELLDAVAAWLCVTWELPIIRALGADSARALDKADTFPQLRAQLRALQDDAREIVDEAIGPLLLPTVTMRDQELISSIDSAALRLVGLIGVSLKKAGFDPLSGGLERAHDGFHLKTMPPHAEMSAAVQVFAGLKASIAVADAERTERERVRAQVEVERLWQASGDAIAVAP